MPRSSPHRRYASRTRPSRVPSALTAFALLALTVGAVAACGDDSGPTHAVAISATPGLHMIDTGGRRLAFHVTPGDGPTVVLDSGGGEDSSYWDALVPRIHTATDATVITYDRAGLGQSDAVPDPWRVDSAVSDLESGLRQLGVTKNVTLVAHSQAGEIATYLAQEDPALLSGAVLADANLPPFFTDDEIARLAAASRPQVVAAKKDPEQPQNRQLISTAESFVATSKAYHQSTWPRTVAASVIVSEKTPFDGSPTDAQRWRDAAASFVGEAPNRSLVTAAGSSHDIPVDRPDVVLTAIESMVAGRR